MKRFSLPALIFALNLAIFGQSDVKPPKITADELLKKHVASVGTVEDLAAVKSRVFVGTGKMVTKKVTPGAFGQLTGTAQLASVGDMFLFAMLFESPVYPYEKAAYDGKNISVGIPQGRKTQLAEYLKAQPAILKDGLFGGVLSGGWPLFDMKSKKSAKLEMNGTAKVKDRYCYKVKYSSGKTGDLKTVLYFDAETFRHVQTIYEYTIQERIGTSSTDRSNSLLEYYTLTESFSDFNIAGKLTVPFTYDIGTDGQGQLVQSGGLGAMNWTVTIRQAYFDEALSPESFKVS